MPFLRNVVKDLVEKRLWPVAVLLVAALVAAPVLIGRSSPDPAPAGVADPAQNAGVADAGDSSRALVSIDQDATDRRHDGGEVRDPFTAPATAKAPAEPEGATQPTVEDSTVPAATAPTVPTDTSGTSTGTGSTGTGTGSGDSGSSSGGSSSGDTTTKKTTTYHVTLRFGQTATKLKTIRDLPRLSPLPSVTDPFFVYLGVLNGGKRAVFMVSSDAKPLGDGVCKPRLSDCQTVELEAGQTEWFDFTNPDGTVTQYQMDLVSIRKVKVASEAKVRAAFARHSRVGAELLRDAAVKATAAAKGAKRYRYAPARGVLVRAKKRKGAAASAAAGAFLPGAAELLTLAPRKQQPGIPVWHWDADKAER